MTRHTRTAGLALLAVLALGLAASACETPVYEYAIHMWQRDPYRVWYFNKGAEDAADKAANDLLASAIDDGANLTFASIDVTDKDEVGVGYGAELWKTHQGKQTPFHVVLTPRGTELAVQRLTVADVKALVDSPKRQETAKLLAGGKQGVMVLMLTGDEATQESAKKAVSDGVAEAKGEGADVGMVELKRNDPKEKWYVEQLLNLEDDLHELDHPMVFGMFGRGHALEPYVGRGITSQNLLELIYFMGGPCSCEIKATAPGLDLLTKLDWETALENWVASDPNQLAIDTGFGGYTEVMIPAEGDGGGEDGGEDGEGGDTEQLEPITPETTVSLPDAPDKPTPTASVDKPSAEAPKPERSAAKPRKPRAQPKPDRKPNLEAKADPKKPATPPSGTKPELEETPAETVAAEQEEEFAGRAPTLPEPVPTLEEQVNTGPPLRSRLGIILGFGLGGGALFALGGGVALMLLRREK